MILEKHLETWIVENLDAVVGEPATLVGRQVQLPPGRRCDILATIPRRRRPNRDSRWTKRPLPIVVDSFDWCVIEVKLHRARAKALVQLLDYMGRLTQAAWFANDGHYQNTAESRITGILVAPEFDDRVAVAACATPNIKLFTLNLSGWSGEAYAFVEVDVDTDHINGLVI